MKQFIFCIIATFAVLTGCSNVQETTLESKSPTWNVTLEYKKNVDTEELREIPYIQYLGEHPLDDESKVTLDILYKNNSSTTNTIDSTILNDKQLLELPTRSQVDSWKDTSKIKVKWKSNGKNHEEILEAKPI